MPIESKELSEGWKIAFIDCKESPDFAHTVITEFEITSPDRRNSSKVLHFTKEFVEYCIGDIREEGAKLTEKRSALIKEKEELFKKLSLVRIEECIDKNSLDEPSQITLEKDLDWVKKIEEGKLQPASKSRDSNTYIYTPERRMGF